MSILATMFVTVFNFQCSVDPSNGFFSALQTFLEIVQLEKSKLFRTTDQKNSQTVLCILGIVVANLLESKRKSQKSNHFESVQNLDSFL